MAAAAELLRSQGERVTQARLAVLEVLGDTSDHLSAEEIVSRAEALLPGLHRATVYRALGTLGELELVTHTHIGGSAAVYHLSLPATEEVPTSAHAHVQCSSLPGRPGLPGRRAG